MTLLWCSIALAEEFRVGIFVGNNEGAPSEQPLLFASADATKMRDLFEELGDIRGQRAELLLDRPRVAVWNAFDVAKRAIDDARQRGDTTTLVFYYSGHGDEESLHLGGTELTHEDLRHWLDASGADVRIAFLDACRSGAIVRQKGGSRGPEFSFGKLEVERTKGTAILTSSAGSEASQEGRSVGGGFFTYFLHSALNGAADADRDGLVTLTEAYSHVHRETSFGTRGGTAGVQTPSFDFDLSGAGDVVLTTLERRDAWLSFVPGLEGKLAIWDETRKRYVAEIDARYPQQLALAPGTYFVHRRDAGWMEEAEYHLRHGETLTVREEDFVSVSYEHTAAKGDLDRQARRASLPHLALRGVIGGRGFTRESLRTSYVPSHTVGGIEARLYTTPGPYFGFDLLSGGGSGEITYADALARDVTVTSHSIGGVAGMGSRTRWVRAGIGGKGEIIGLSRSFPGGVLETQRSFGAAFGLNTWLGLHIVRFSLDLQASWLTLMQTWDEEKGLPYVEIVWAAGYRF